MTAARAQSNLRQLPPEERQTFIKFVLATLTDFAREYADDALRAAADGLDSLVETSPPLVRVSVGFGTALLRFAAGRIEGAGS